MSAGKWIGGVLGFMAAGPLGALAGVVVGAIIDDLMNHKDNSNLQEGPAPEASADGQRNSFLFSLLVLAAYIVKADGKVMHSEMQLVRNFLRQNFGEQAVAEGEDIMLRLFREQDRTEAQSPGAYRQTIEQCCRQIADNMDESQRLQLLHFLVLISQADGNVSPSEIAALREVAYRLRLSADEVDSLLSLRGESLDDAYRILEVSPQATDDEVKAAYRRLALKHHPDRVATLGEDIRQAAQKKFQEITEAKEKIFKARGLK